MALICVFCNNPQTTVFESKEYLNAHIRSVHLKYFPYQCGVCSTCEVTFRTHSKTALLRHSKREHCDTKIHIIYDEDESLENQLEHMVDQCSEKPVKNEPNDSFERDKGQGKSSSNNSLLEAIASSSMGGLPVDSSPMAPNLKDEFMVEMSVFGERTNSANARSLSPTPSADGALEAIGVIHQSPRLKSGVVKGPVKLVMTEFCSSYARNTIKEYSFGSQFSPHHQEAMLQQFLSLFSLRAPTYSMPYDAKTMIKKLTRQIKDRRREIHMEAITQYPIEFGQVTNLQAKFAQLNLCDNFEVLPDYAPDRDTYMIEIRIMHLPNPLLDHCPDYVYAMVINLGHLCDADRNVSIGDFSYNFFSLYSPSKCAVKMDWLYPKGTFPVYQGFETKNTRRQCRTEPVDTSLRAPRSLRKGHLFSDEYHFLNKRPFLDSDNDHNDEL